LIIFAGAGNRVRQKKVIPQRIRMPNFAKSIAGNFRRHSRRDISFLIQFAKTQIKMCFYPPNGILHILKSKSQTALNYQNLTYIVKI
jgi:hypothetical protein